MSSSNRTDWWERAECRGQDVNLFFPETGAYVAPRQFCKRCAVRAECLDYALSFTSVEDQAGMFGGVGPRGRNDIRQLMSYVPVSVSPGA
jgi:hypothetical protein